MAMAQQPRQFHPLPVIGYPESYYTKHIKDADAAGDQLAHCAFKVGQYVTCALDPKRSWEEKCKYFRHTLKHHCLPPSDCDDETMNYFQKLYDLVCRYGSQESRRLARQEHDSYCMRLEMGVPREQLVEEAEVFFPQLLGHGGCPEFLTKEAFAEISMLRDKWI